MLHRNGHKLSRFLGPLEADIMEILWRQNPLPAKEVRVQLRLKKKLASTTVLTVLGRLVEKGLLNKTLAGRIHNYTPVENRETFVQNRIEEILKALADEFPEEFRAVSTR